MMDKLNVYLEVGNRRTFAAALDWPGWCRVGKDEAAALQALWDYSPRYARIVRPVGLGFLVPDDVAGFVVVERIKGNATTDFGAPGLVPESDALPLDEAELQRLQALLKACWHAFDEMVEMASGKALRMGPRGGGRSVTGIVEHTLGAELGYLSQLGGKLAQPESADQIPGAIRQAILHSLEASAHGEIAEYGPRGGKRWPPRYFARRDAWHVLDHLWEIEDRLE